MALRLARRNREPMHNSSGIALARKWLRSKRRCAGRIRRYEAKQRRAGDGPFLVPTLRAPSWRAVCDVALFTKGSTLGFTATRCIPSRPDSARPRGVVHRFHNASAQDRRIATIMWMIETAITARLDCRQFHAPYPAPSTIHPQEANENTSNDFARKSS